MIVCDGNREMLMSISRNSPGPILFPAIVKLFMHQPVSCTRLRKVTKVEQNAA